MSAIFDSTVVQRWVAKPGMSAAEVFGLPPATGQMVLRRQVVKRRTWTSAGIARLANAYFRVAGAPVRFQLGPGDWQAAEVDCFTMLNAPARAHRRGGGAVSADRLPGESFLALARSNRLTAFGLRAAAREFRRAHHMMHPCSGMPFTHGDATLANMIYDASGNRARLIDFETFHLAELPLAERRADDLAVFVLDILSLAPRGEAVGLAMGFLREYDDPEVWAAVPKCLRRPRGLGWFFWKVRTNFVAARAVLPRIAAVEAILAEWVQALSLVPPAGASAA